MNSKNDIGNEFQIELDHIGIATESIDQALPFYKFLGLSENHREIVESEKVTTSFIPLQNRCDLELLQPTDQNSVIAKALKSRGPGIHHICLRVKGIDALAKRLVEAKVQLINETPRPGAHGARVVFIHPRSTGGILIELSEKPIS